MKDSTDAKEKTSRRGFTKTIATALVAVPVISSLSSCAQKPVTPPATPSPSPSPPRERGANPPVIIDGGSFEILVPTLEKHDNDPGPNPPNPPKSYAYKFKQKNDSVLGAIQGILVVDDYAYPLLREYSVGNDTLQVQIWIAKAVTESGNDDNDTDGAVYENISTHTHPDIVIQGGKIEIRMDRKISKDRKIFKRAGWNQKRYHINDWDPGHKPFRLAKVKVFVSSNATALYDSERDNTDVEKGFRIILIFA